MHEMKQGDTKPDLVGHLGYGTYGTPSWVPQDLTGCTIRVHVVTTTTPATVKVDGICQIDGDPTAGDVRYLWAADGSDTDADGSTTVVIYNTEFQITFADGSVLTAPNGSVNPQVKINPQLA